MKRIYEFITKANQILLFLALIGVIAAAVLIPAFQNVRSLERPHVAVAVADTAPAAMEVRDVQFLGKSGDYFVFGIVKHTVAGNATSPKPGAMKLYMSSGRDDDDDGEIVNAIFSNGERVVKTLLPNDGLILQHRLQSPHESKPFPAIFFTCVTEDTNGDHVLDHKDRHDLVIVDPTLKRVDITIKHSVDFDIVSSTLMVVKTRTEDSLQYFQVDTTTGTKTEIVWK